MAEKTQTPRFLVDDIQNLESDTTHVLSTYRFHRLLQKWQVSNKLLVSLQVSSAMGSDYLFPYNFLTVMRESEGIFLVEKVCVRHSLIILKCMDKWDISLEIQLVRKNIFKHSFSLPNEMFVCPCSSELLIALFSYSPVFDNRLTMGTNIQM